jgi:hypothetical protein
MFNSALCLSALSSLREKIGLLSERSKGLLESQVGDEIVQLVTRRLTGGEVEDATLKTLLVKQVEMRLGECVGVPVRELLQRAPKVTVKRLDVEESDLSWEYQAGFEISLHWKEVSFRWDDQNKRGNVAMNLDTLSVRDTFLYLVNLPPFGQMITRRLAKMME